MVFAVIAGTYAIKTGLCSGTAVYTIAVPAIMAGLTMRFDTTRGSVEVAFCIFVKQTLLVVHGPENGGIPIHFSLVASGGE